jgi:TonB family protein
MLRISACLLACAALLLPAHASDAQTPDPAPSMCAEPNLDARVIRAQQPVTPAAAVAQGISGEVVVLISLDENSKIVSAVIARSPSALLNVAALEAAKNSVYRTRVVACHPVAEQYRFIVEFTSGPPKPPSISDYFLGTWYCASEIKSNIVKAYGLVANGSMMRLYNPYVTADGVMYGSEESYTEAGGTLRVVSPMGGVTYFGTSAGWIGNALTFDGSRSGTGVAAVRSRETYTRVDDDHFMRTFEDATSDSAMWTTTSRETCARISRPLPAPSPVPSP